MYSVSDYIGGRIGKIETSSFKKKQVSSKIYYKIEDYIEGELFDVLWDNVGGKIRGSLWDL